MRTITGSRYPRLLLTLLVCCLFLLSSVVTFAQSTTQGAIGGTVVDPQDKVIAGATVTVKNLGSNLTTTVKTDAQGYYRVNQLEPATYQVSVKAEGFAPYRAESVVVTVGSLTSVSPHLTLGATEQVDVSAEVSLINVASNDFAPTINETAIKNLPINGGRWSSFSLLTPGVVSDSNGFGLVSVRGMSPLLNNVTVDGADNNQAYFSEERGRTRAGYSTAKLAVQEFQVNTSNYTTEYGRAAGAVINTVTKAGSNQIHGEGYWEDRDNNWGTTNPYTTLTSYNSNTETVTTSRYKPVDVRKMGGFSLGGPIIKDRLFWFFAFDRYHHNFPGTAVANSSTFFAMPDAALPTGTACGGSGTAAPSTADANVCTFAGYINGVSASKVTTTQYAAAQAQWLTDMYGSGSTLGLIADSGPTPRTGDQTIFFPKVDWVINQRNHAFFELNRMRWWSPAGIQTQATNVYGISTFGNDYVKDTWGVAKLDTMLTNSMSNQIRFQYGRDFELETYQKPSKYDSANLIGSSSPYGLPPEVAINGFYIGTTVYGNRVKYPSEFKTQIADTINYQHGNHAIKFGIDWMHSDDTIQNLYEQYGYYSYSNAAGYFADLANSSLKEYSSYYQGFQGTSINNPVHAYEFSTNDWAAFVQDDWKASRRLTVNLGLRYETELYPNAFSALSNTITLGTQSLTLGKMPNAQNNFGPRAGFAFDLFGDGKTVLRGGYGMYFGRTINSTLYSAMVSTGNLTSQLSQPTYTIKYNSACAPTFPNVLTANPTCAASLTLDYFDPHFKMPQIHEFDLALQQQLPWKTVFSINYLSSLGRHLQSFTDSNLANPGTNGAPSTITYTLSNQSSGNTISGMPLSSSYTATVPFYTSRLNSAYGPVVENVSSINSSYNALVAQLEKRMSNSVQFSASYTWSHALDFGVNGTTGAASYPAYVDPHNVRYAEYGNSNYNVPNRFTFHAVVDSWWHAQGLKKYFLEGWEAAPVIQIQNGLPYSVTTYSSYTPTLYTSPTTSYTGASYGMLGADGSFLVPGTPRNGWKQPNTYVFDLRLAKSVTLAEKYKFEFTADAFNLLNHNNVTGITTTAAYTGSTTKPTSGAANPVLVPYTSNIAGATGSQYTLFGVPNSGNSNFVYGVRQLQLGVRVTF